MPAIVTGRINEGENRIDPLKKSDIGKNALEVLINFHRFINERFLFYSFSGYSETMKNQLNS